MKKLILIIFLVSAGTVLCEKIGTWTLALERESTNNFYFGICMADSFNGMILGMNEKLLYVKKTTDGGNSWENCYTEKRQFTDVFQVYYKTPRHVAFTDEKNCYITLDSGNIIKTNDGGSHWSKINITKEQLKCIVMHDANIGAITTYKSLYLTKDGWNTWQKSDFPESLDSLYFFDFNFALPDNVTIILMVRNKGQYYTMKSSDLGKNWELYPYGKIGFLDIKFLDNSIGFNCNDHYYTDTITNKYIYEASIKKTTDGGKTWFSVFDSSQYRGFWSMDIKDGVIFATGGFSRAYMSKDTGRTWINLRDYDDYPGELKRTWLWCTAISKDEFLACDEFMGVWKFSNIPNSVFDPSTNSNYVVYPNPATEYIKIKGNGSPVSIYNSLGVKLIDSFTNCDIDISGLVPGVYFVQMIDGLLKFIKSE